MFQKAFRKQFQNHPKSIPKQMRKPSEISSNIGPILTPCWLIFGSFFDPGAPQGPSWKRPCFWTHFWLDFGSHLDSNLAPFWLRFRCRFLYHFCERSGNALEPPSDEFWGHFGSVLEAFWGHFWSTFKKWKLSSRLGGGLICTVPGGLKIIVF